MNAEGRVAGKKMCQSYVELVVTRTDVLSWHLSIYLRSQSLQLQEQASATSQDGSRLPPSFLGH